VSQPEKLGKYEIRRTLGKGGMGVVYEGFDPQIQRRVAIKAILRGLVEDEPGSASSKKEELQSRFQREAQAAGRLSHPHIVTVYEYGEDVATDADGHEVRTPFIVMEFVEGAELKSFLDKGVRLSLPQITRMMGQLLEALGYSHERGVVHRDIKPANIMVLKDESIKVADFGIARLDSSTLTVHGSVFGSPHYMSPEQMLGEPVDRRSDLYAAGVVLYELLTGVRPFDGPSFTVVTVKALKERALAPSELSVSIPKAYDALVARALARRPDERFQSAEEFRQALLAIEAARPVDEDATALRRSPLQSGGGPEPTQARQSGGAQARRSVLLGVAAAALVALAAGLLMLMPGRPSQKERFTTASNSSSSSVASSRRPPGSAPEPTAEPGVASIAVVGVAPAGDQNDPQQRAAAAAQVKLDAEQRLVAKAAALYVDPASLRDNYAILRERLFSRGAGFIKSVLEEQPPRPGQNGVVYGMLRARVDVRGVRKLLNEVSDETRIELARNDGHPRVSVLIRTQDEGASPQRSELAENILKERIRAYGCTLVDEAAARTADFRIEGTAALRKLSARLPASGLVIEKFVLSYWTLRASDARSGDQIYFNTKVPEKQSWNSRELALQDIGRLVGDELSRKLFLRNYDYPPRRAVLRVEGLPPANSLLPGLHTALQVMDAVPQQDNSQFAVELSGGSQGLRELVQQAVVAPLNQQLERACFSLKEATDSEARIQFDARSCADAAGRLQMLPLESLWGLPSGGRRQARLGVGFPVLAAMLPGRRVELGQLPIAELDLRSQLGGGIPRLGPGAGR
jgi:serine/threonine-protein kinase